MPLTVIIVAETPEHNSTRNPDQPSSTMQGYRVEGEDREDVAAVMARVLGENLLGTFGVGTSFFGYDEAAAERRVLRSQLAEE